MVREYPDVFLEELLGLLSHREIDFAIEIEPNIGPHIESFIHNGSSETEVTEGPIVGVVGKGLYST